MTYHKKAALYIRVSHEEQAMKGYSLQAQENRLRAYAAFKGYEVVDVYKDEGVSARHRPGHRREFARMMHDVTAGRIEIIVFIKLDRWFRNVSDYYSYQSILDAHHVEWETTEEDYNTSTAQGRLYLNIKLSIAQNESDTTAERIRFVFADKIKRREAISGKLPLGYAIENKRIVPNQHAAVVRDIFHHYLAVKSIRATMHYLYNRYHIKRTYPAMVKLLRNEKYTGLAYGDPQYLPPLISQETFSAVQHLLEEQRRFHQTPHRLYLFTGLLHCPHCGKRLVGLTRHYKTRQYIYYHCPSPTGSPIASHSFRLKEAELEEKLLIALPCVMERLTKRASISSAFTFYLSCHHLYPHWHYTERRHYWQTLLRSIHFDEVGDPVITLCEEV